MTKTTISALIEQFMLANPSITQHRTIAKLLYGNYPMVFKSVDKYPYCSQDIFTDDEEEEDYE